MNEQRAKFHVGQTIHHRRFDYRGVVIDVDASFQGEEDWYRVVARSRPAQTTPLGPTFLPNTAWGFCHPSQPQTEISVPHRWSFAPAGWASTIGFA